MARKSIADRIAEKNLFTMGTDTGTVKDTGTDKVKGTGIDTGTGTDMDKGTGTVMGTGTDTVMGTDTGTYLEGILKPSDVYVRKVYYPLDYQAKHIKELAKKYKRTESEIVRVALDYFMKGS